MSNLHIQGTRSTPSVVFDRGAGQLRLSGASYPENAAHFYKPVLDWVKDFAEQLSQPVTLDIDLKYLNTSSTKCLMNLIRLFAQSPEGKRLVTINWYYDHGSDTLLEVAQEFQSGIQLPFQIIEKD